MIFTIQQYYTNGLDDILNQLRKDYNLRIHGFSASGRYVYALVEITQRVWDVITDYDDNVISSKEGKPLPEDTGEFSV
jgi:hypothetical protein